MMGGGRQKLLVLLARIVLNIEEILAVELEKVKMTRRR